MKYLVALVLIGLFASAVLVTDSALAGYASEEWHYTP